MKKFSATMIIIAAAMLAGCTDGGTSSTPESLTSTVESAPTQSGEITSDSSDYSNVSDETNNTEPLPFTLFGADNVQITFADVNSITDKDGNPIAPEAVKDPDWYEILCDGFAYLAEPSISLNSRDNADLYDPEKLIFDSLPEYTDAKYKRFNVGDKFGELTLKSASVTFSRIDYEDDEKAKEGKEDAALTEEQIREAGMSFAGMFEGCSASFDGTVTMTGYMRVVISEYGVEEGTVLFVPDADSLVLPLMNYHIDYDTDSINTALWQWNVNDFTYATEYPTIRLGNINNGTNISGISADGTSTKVKVTVTNISMFSNLHMSSFIDGELVSVEPV